MIHLSPYIWHQDFCPAPAHEGDCCCGYAEAKALAEELDRRNRAAMPEIDLDAIEQRAKAAKKLPDALNRHFIPALRTDILSLVACCRKLIAEQSEMRLKISMLAAKDAKTETTQESVA